MIIFDKNNFFNQKFCSLRFLLSDQFILLIFIFLNPSALDCIIYDFKYEIRIFTTFHYFSWSISCIRMCYSIIVNEELIYWIFHINFFYPLHLFQKQENLELFYCNLLNSLAIAGNISYRKYASRLFCLNIVQEIFLISSIVRLEFFRNSHYHKISLIAINITSLALFLITLEHANLLKWSTQLHKYFHSKFK